ncbi:MAG: hypothetical protein J3K34DRAFT_405120 [Monoraphidium minutum]|nr:MAG: hypothetical protein J3K34DRAFT_405120 [Monoraphidium minutum]
MSLARRPAVCQCAAGRAPGGSRDPPAPGPGAHWPHACVGAAPTMSADPPPRFIEASFRLSRQAPIQFCCATPLGRSPIPLAPVLRLAAALAARPICGRRARGRACTLASTKQRLRLLPIWRAPARLLRALSYFAFRAAALSAPLPVALAAAAHRREPSLRFGQCQTTHAHASDSAGSARASAARTLLAPPLGAPSSRSFTPIWYHAPLPHPKSQKPEGAPPAALAGARRPAPERPAAAPWPVPSVAAFHSDC